MKYKFLDNISKREYPHVMYCGKIYVYLHKLAKHRGDICLSTKNPEVYLNGTYLYSDKDPGDGKAFVVIATNNSDLKMIPQLELVDNPEAIGKKQFGCAQETCTTIDEQYKYLSGFVEGYNNAKGTFKWTDEDMEEFTRFQTDYYFNLENKVLSTKKLMELWQEGRIKIIYVDHDKVCECEEQGIPVCNTCGKGISLIG